MCGLFAYSTFDKTYKNEILSKLIELSKKEDKIMLELHLLKTQK